MHDELSASKGLVMRSYRILALGVTFFIVGGVFLVLDARTKQENVTPALVPTPTYAVAHNAQAPSGGGQSLLAGYPAPSTFTKITYTKDSKDKDNIVLLKGSCATPYVVILMFHERFDYREDPTKAVVNRSMPCPENKQFSYSIFFRDLAGITPGTYYAFVADQQEGGVWYNPR